LTVKAGACAPDEGILLRMPTRHARRAAVAVLLLSLGPACTPSPDARTKPPPVQNGASASSPSNELADEAPLVQGHAVFRGMIRPTKGGYEVHGAIVDDSALRKALASAPGSDPKNADWFLGAVVRIEGEVQKHEAAPAQSKDEPVAQMRAGSWTEVTRIDSATIVEPAKVIEGTLSRSKGFFALAGRLVTPADLDWSLAPEGGREGDRVRLHGQPRTVVCEPNAQCLIQGSLPLFDVGRAERLP
jgi:hypothetical protein